MSLGDYPIMKFVSHKHWNVKSFHVFLDLVNRIWWLFRFSFHTFCHWSPFEDEQISPCRTLSCFERGLKTDHSHTLSLTGRDPFNQNFWKFRSKTQWIGSVQPEKFRKNGSTFWGGPLFPVGPVGILVEWIAPTSFSISNGQDYVIAWLFTQSLLSSRKPEHIGWP